MDLEFTVGEPGSIVMNVKARVTTKAELDKLVEAVSASRELFSDDAASLTNQS